MGVHALGIRFEARENTHRVDRLVDRHAAAAQRAATERFGGLQQRGADREIDDVRDPQIAVQQFDRQRQAGQFRHAGRRRVNQAVGGGERLARSEVAGADLRGREALLQFVGERAARVASTSNSVSDLRAHGQRGMRDRRTRAARAKLHHAFQRHIRQAALERARETGPVGVVADAFAVLEQHRVDRAECAGVVGEFVEQRNHRLLARIRDVQSVEAHAFGGGEQIGQRGAIELQRFQIDAAVHVVQPELAALFFVHRGSQRSADARADQADQIGMRRGLGAGLCVHDGARF